MVNVIEEEKNVPGFVEWKRMLGVDVPSYMIGLVREWVLDVWSESYPLELPLSKLDAPVNLLPQKADGMTLVPTGDMTTTRVLRGGGFISPEGQLTVRYRAPHRSLNVNPDVGFRCVKPIRLPSNS